MHIHCLLARLAPFISPSARPHSPCTSAAEQGTPRTSPWRCTRSSLPSRTVTRAPPIVRGSPPKDRTRKSPRNNLCLGKSTATRSADGGSASSTLKRPPLRHHASVAARKRVASAGVWHTPSNRRRTCSTFRGTTGLSFTGGPPTSLESAARSCNARRLAFARLLERRTILARALAFARAPKPRPRPRCPPTALPPPPRALPRGMVRWL